jgi:hypothetical protein
MARKSRQTYAACPNDQAAEILGYSSVEAFRPMLDSPKWAVGYVDAKDGRKYQMRREMPLPQHNAFCEGLNLAAAHASRTIRKLKEDALANISDDDLLAEVQRRAGHADNCETFSAKIRDLELREYKPNYDEAVEAAQRHGVKGPEIDDDCIAINNLGELPVILLRLSFGRTMRDRAEAMTDLEFWMLERDMHNDSVPTQHSFYSALV